LDKELQHHRVKPGSTGTREGGPLSARREEIVDFKPVLLKAPFLLRCAALFVDYIVVIAVPVLSLIINQLAGGKSGVPGVTTWLFTTLVAISNFIILPTVSSQSIGKMLTGIRITTSGGKSASVTAILLRNIVGYLVTALTLGLGFLIAGLTPSGRALHDYLSGTMVIYAKRRQLERP
jgi:uncharacterized RDD family membrane protein YckC